MKVLSKVRTLSWRDRVLLLLALRSLCRASIVVRLMPVSSLRKNLQRPSGILNSTKHVYEVERIVWAITVVGRLVPRATCLVRSVAARNVLVRFGYPAIVRIGVKKGPGEPFGAHAWVEVNNVAVMRGEEEYAALPIS